MEDDDDIDPSYEDWLVQQEPDETEIDKMLDEMWRDEREDSQISD